jgi:hypothetical protein
LERAQFIGDGSRFFDGVRCFRNHFCNRRTPFFLLCASALGRSKDRAWFLIMMSLWPRLSCNSPDIRRRARFLVHHRISKDSRGATMGSDKEAHTTFSKMVVCTQQYSPNFGGLPHVQAWRIYDLYRKKDSQSALWFRKSKTFFEFPKISEEPSAMRSLSSISSRRIISRFLALCTMCTIVPGLSGCLVAGYSSGGGWFVWPGSLGLIVIALLLFFLMRRR